LFAAVEGLNSPTGWRRRSEQRPLQHPPMRCTACVRHPSPVAPTAALVVVVGVVPGGVAEEEASPISPIDQ